MEEFAIIKPDSLPVISENEVLKAIKSLNSGKSADEMGLTAEHLKYSGTVLLAAIAAVFNEILRTKAIPDAFKSGIPQFIKKGIIHVTWTTIEESLSPPFLASCLKRLY